LKLILDAGTGGVVWAEDDVNVTQIVLDELTSTATGSAQKQPPPTGDPKE
jgi:hypothetical protein